LWEREEIQEMLRTVVLQGSELTSDWQAMRCSQFLRSRMQGCLAPMATLWFHFALSATLWFQRAKDSGLALLKIDPLQLLSGQFMIPAAAKF